jgi:hypothetical protein
MSMSMKWIAAVALLLALTGPAWAQSEDDIAKAAGKEIGALVSCLRQQTAQIAQTKATSDQIVDRAYAKCQGERQEVWLAMQRSPANLKPGEATRQVDDALASLRPGVKDIVTKARK